MAATEENGFLPALRFRRLTPYFDAVVRVTVREGTFKQRLLDGLDLTPGASVLDVGAGTGTLAIAVKEHWPGAAVTGLDADPEILEIARRKAREANRDVDFVEAFSTEIPFPAQSFDAVVSTLFFHHLDPEAKRRTLAEIERVLKPGGSLHVGDWGKPADPLQAALFTAVRAFDGFDVTAQNAHGELPGLIEDAGLRVAGRRDRLRTTLGTIELLSAVR